MESIIRYCHLPLVVLFEVDSEGGFALHPHGPTRLNGSPKYENHRFIPNFMNVLCIWVYEGARVSNFPHKIYTHGCLLTFEYASSLKHTQFSCLIFYKNIEVFSVMFSPAGVWSSSSSSWTLSSSEASSSSANSSSSDLSGVWGLLFCSRFFCCDSKL